MPYILVSGLINIETTLRVERFPVDYCPVRYPFFGVRTTVSGVGFNVAAALAALGDQVTLASLVGRDAVEEMVRSALAEARVPGDFVLAQLEQTAGSVILYDAEGRRQINVDLKDIQEQPYPPEVFARALQPCTAAALCNINFSRPFLAEARQAGKLVATDVHAIGQIDDPYNREFMAAAHVLFMSHEHLPCQPEEWAAAVIGRYHNDILVVGLGAEGALLAVRRDGYMGRVPAVRTRPVVSTIGAGDALFSTFLHFYQKTWDPYHALRCAVYFASYKIGEAGAAEGFLDEEGLAALMENEA